MRIALIAPPFLCVPPQRYGGTELFVAHLAESLQRAGHDVVVYTVGASEVGVERRWLYPDCDWPLPSDSAVQLKDLAHNAWAIRDASRTCDIIHVQSATALAFSKWLPVPIVYTVHHAREDALSTYYSHYSEVQYVMISDAQRQREAMPRMETIHHGVDLSRYRLQEKKRDYLAFLGRFAPVKGVHLAIEAATRAGIPLKMAGEIQPIYKSYFETMVKPHIDGKFIEYVGEADLATKNELLGNARAMLFPVQWNEPFGLVMIESMACGTPVLALAGGSVPEVVQPGLSGAICASVEELAEAAMALSYNPSSIRRYCEQNFSVEVMARKYMHLYERVYNEATLATPIAVAEDLGEETVA